MSQIKALRIHQTVQDWIEISIASVGIIMVSLLRIADRYMKDSDNNSGMSLKELLNKVGECIIYLKTRWLKIFIIGILGGVLVYIYTYNKKPVYTSTTTFVLEGGESTGVGQYAGLASMVGVDLGGGGGGLFQGNNIIELYKSRTMIEKTLFSPITEAKGELLIDRYIKFNNLKATWAKNDLVKDIAFFNRKDLKPQGLRLQDSLVGNIVSDIRKNYLYVQKPDKQLSIIKVDVKAKDELFAKEFNDHIVKNVNEFYIQTKTKKALQNVSILQKKVDSVRKSMNNSIYSAAAAADATPNLNPVRQIQRIAPVQRSQYNAETNKQILGELIQHLELSKVALLKETPLIQVLDNPIYPLDVSNYNESIFGVLGFIFFSMFGAFIFFVKWLLGELLKS